MSKLLQQLNQAGVHHSWMFHCPGCEHAHSYDSRWAFNGDQTQPTFTPSLLVKGRTWNGSAFEEQVCHLFMVDGKLQFLADCTHKLAGQTVDVPDWDET